MLGLIQKREDFNMPKLYSQYSIQLHTHTHRDRHTERGLLKCIMAGSYRSKPLNATRS